MKKSIKTIAFALLTVGMLAGCKPSPTPAKDWDDETKRAMTILLGEVLPYVDLNEETTYFEMEYEAGFVEFVLGDDNDTNLLGDYGDKLTSAGFTVETIEGESYYYKENEAGYQIALEFAYYEATAEYAAGNEIHGMSMMPDFTEWPDEVVELVFLLNEAEVYYGVPALEAANATFLVDTYYYWGFIPYGALVQIDGATEAEINTWINTTLKNAGWTVEGDATDGQATKAFPEFDGAATVAFYEEEGSFYVIPLFGLSAIPTATWPGDKIAAAFNTLGVPAFDIPAPDSTGHTYEYRFDRENLEYLDFPSYCYDYLYINDMSEDQFAAYVAKFEAAGWEADGWSDEFELTKHDDTAKATANLELEWTSSASYGDYATLTIYYIMDPDPSPDFPAEDIAAAFATLGLPAFEVPAPEGENVGFKFTYDESNINYLDNPALCYDNVQVYGLDEAGVEAYFAKLDAAGWDVSYEASYYTEFQKHFDSCHGTATIRYYLYSEDYGYDYLRIYYIVDPDPSPVWPAEEIAEILGATVTDTLPACTYSGATFKAYDDTYGSGVTVFVGEGNEAAAMAAYADTLTAAGFVPANSANTYASPNNQFTAWLYVGIDGAFNIELTLVRHLNNEVAAFFNYYDITGVQFPDLTSFESNGVDWDYTGITSSGYFDTWIDSNIESDVAAAFAALNYAGATEKNTEYNCYLMYDPSQQITVQVAYVSSYMQTLIRIYPAVVS